MAIKYEIKKGVLHYEVPIEIRRKKSESKVRLPYKALREMDLDEESTVLVTIKRKKE